MSLSLTFPVIAFWDDLMDVSSNERDLHAFSARKYAQWRRLGLVLDVIDSSGMGYALADPTPCEGRCAHRLLAWIFNSSFAVSFGRITEMGPIELADLKERVLTNMRQNSEIYDADGELDARRAAVIRASDHRAVIEVFRSFM